MLDKEDLDLSLPLTTLTRPTLPFLTLLSPLGCLKPLNQLFLSLLSSLISSFPLPSLQTITPSPPS